MLLMEYPFPNIRVSFFPAFAEKILGAIPFCFLGSVSSPRAASVAPGQGRMRWALVRRPGRLALDWVPVMESARLVQLPVQVSGPVWAALRWPPRRDRRGA